MRLFRSTVLLFLTFSLLLSACNSTPTPEEQAMLAAEGYYRHLLAGEYEQFLEGGSRYATLPADYRKQLCAALKQFMAQQQTLHRGITAVQPLRAVVDSLTPDKAPTSPSCQANVFLLLSYGDSTLEEVVLPMIRSNGRWTMK